MPGNPPTAVGADGAPRGWLLACLVGGRARATELRLCDDVDAIAQMRGDAKVAIDVPIGLLDDARARDCDLEARARLRGRSSVVFAPPARYMLEAADDYAALRKLVEKRRRTDPQAKSLSAQAAAIAPKIKEVDDWVRARPDSHAWLYECHPELSFLALNGNEPLPSKHSAAGVLQRLRLVTAEFPDAEERIAAAAWGPKEAGLSDMLDAYAALSTARRLAGGKAGVIGGEPDDHGVPMRMAV